MRKSWKKGMAGAISLCMATTCVPGVSEIGNFVHTMKTVEAETTEKALSGTCGENATWEYNPETKTLTIGGTGEMESYIDYFDNEYELYGKPWENYMEEIEKVVIGDEITYIGIGSFYGCSALEEVQFGKKLEIIGAKAFGKCVSLQKIELSGAIYEVGDYAFTSCTSLTEVHVGKALTLIGMDIFVKCNAIDYIQVDPENTCVVVEGNRLKQASFIGKCGPDAIWKYDEKKKTMTITGTGRVYSDIDWLYEEDIEGHITGVWNIHRDEVEKVIIGDEITTLESEAFKGCTALKEVTLGKKVSVAGKRAFMGCTALEKVTFGAAFEDLGMEAFKGCTALKEIKMGDNLEYMDTSAFEGCKSLTNLYVGKALTTIDDTAFNGCNGIKQIKVHAKNKNFMVQEKSLVNKKKAKWMLGCFSSDTTCYIGKSVKYINPEIILENTRIKNFKVNSKNKYYSSKNGLLYSKNGKILYLCPRGKNGTATVSDKATKMNGNGAKYSKSVGTVSVFGNCAKIEKIVLGKKISQVDFDFTGCTKLKEVKVVSGNKTYANAKGAILSKNKKKLIRFISAENGTYTVPNGVKEVVKDAFDCSGTLKQLVLSDSVIDYEHNAGSALEIDSITLGKKYYNDGDLVWISGISGLKKVNVSAQNPYYSSIDGIVYNKEQTTLLACPSGVESYQMPNTVTSVDPYAFESFSQLKQLSVSDEITDMTTWDLSDFSQLNKLYIGKKVEKIEHASTELLEQISVSAENQTYKSEDGMLYTKNGNRLIWCPQQKQGTVTIASGTAIIGEQAFSLCEGVTEVVIPDSVTSIEKNALEGMMENVVFCVPAGMKEYYALLLTKETGFQESMKIKDMEEK